MGVPKMTSAIFPDPSQGAPMLFASVLLIACLFLIGRVAHLSQPRALMLALLPMAVALALNVGFVA